MELHTSELLRGTLLYVPPNITKILSKPAPSKILQGRHIYFPMKKLLIVLLFGVAPCLLLAQKHDYIWIAGRQNFPNITTHGGMVIDFKQKPVSVYYNYRNTNMFVCNASICDTAGNLIAYSNGCEIGGADDQIIENGEEINPGYLHQLRCVQYDDGYGSGIQSAVFLPAPQDDSVYYLFHKQIRTFSNNTLSGFTEKLLYSVVNQRFNKGLGKVTAKNVEIIKDTLSFGELITVKHSNGKDWWIITPRRNNNAFYILKFTKDGIVDTFTQKIGITASIPGEGYGQVVFSPDGTKLYRTNPFNPIMVYDFDRETGVFTKFDTIHYDYGNQLSIGEVGCAISPNGRFLYLGARFKLFQLDLQAPDISASQTLVAEWDGFAAPVATLFQQLQLAPDCKIYGLAGGDTRYFHVIHNPDAPGLACNVEQHGLVLPTPCGASMPSFPNFRLGPPENPGLPCTSTVGTIGGPVSPLPALSVFPNPATTYVKLVVNQALEQGANWYLFDLHGRLVRSAPLDTAQAGIEISLSGLPAGAYFWSVDGKAGAVFLRGKVLVL